MSEAQTGTYKRPDVARVMEHYARAFETGIYAMPDSDLPHQIRRIVADLRMARAELEAFIRDKEVER